MIIYREVTQLLILIALSLTSYSQVKFIDSLKVKKVFQDIGQKNFSTIYNKKSIPKKVKECLSIIDGKKFRIVNPNEKFNSSDIILNERLPKNKLVYFAFNKEYYLICYEQGGFGRSFYVRILEHNNSAIRCIFTFQVSWHSSIDEFRMILNNSSGLKIDEKKSTCF